VELRNEPPVPCVEKEMKYQEKESGESTYLDKKGGDITDDEVLRGTLGSDQ
jgi:hypothetical protein